MSLNFTTALELVETKIQRNNVFIDLLETESSILKKSILVFYRLIEHNNKNTDLIKKINQIEAQQTQTYCQIRQEQVSNLTEQINSGNPNFEDLYEDIAALKVKCQNYMILIDELNTKIPDQTIVTNYKIPIKLDNCREVKKNI